MDPAYAIAMEEISRDCAACGVIMSVNNVSRIFSLQDLGCGGGRGEHGLMYPAYAIASKVYGGIN